MVCRLCKKEVQLIRQSHIIPKFMYKGIYEKSKKLVEVNLWKTHEPKFRPTPTYDEYILCKKCDNEVLGRLETYAADVFFERTDLDFERVSEGGVTSLIVKNVDYKKFKLFLLSILWRASISKQELFKEIDLGRKHEETIRAMIYENNPGEADEFPVCVFGIRSRENLMLRTVVQPRRLKYELNTSYMFFINGLFYYFNVSQFGMQDMFRRLPIDRNNQMTLGIFEDSLGGPEFFDMFLGRKIRLRHSVFDHQRKA